MATDPYKYFRVEARELLEQLSRGALDLEKGPLSADAISHLLRAAHTLKGAARVVRQPAIAEDAHRLEDLFAGIRDAGSTPPGAIDEILAALDRMASGVAALDMAPDDRVAPAAASAAAIPEVVAAIRPDLHDADDVERTLAAAERELALLGPRVEGARDVAHLIALIERHLARFDGAAIDASRVAGMRALAADLRTHFDAFRRDVEFGLGQVEKEMRQAADAAGRLKLVPAGAMFTFLERAVRDAAQSLGKQAVFDGRGGDVRVDGSLLAVAQGALLQLVRNAVAHGIELPGTRIAEGKPAEGRVTVAVASRGSAVVFTCADDGAGIDVDAVRRRMQQKGVPDALTADPLSLLDALFRTGISTSETVTSMSGRGIGLDIVRDASKRLGGTVTMRTEPGHGTTVELVIPASVMSMHALLVEAAGVRAAIPVDAIRSTIRITPDQIIRTADGTAIAVDGESRPVASLGRLLQPAASDSGFSEARPGVVLGEGAAAMVLTADRITGTASVIRRPLPANAPVMPAIAGACVDAAGHARLVLDPAGLAAEAHTARIAPAPIHVAPNILVVDDSLTTRMLEASILESAGYVVTLAASGEEGLEKARAGDHALALVDVEMPGMDGFTFIERLRADPALRNLPAILVTSRSSVEDQRRGREAGAQDYIVKSDFDQARLLDRIRTLVR